MAYVKQSDPGINVLFNKKANYFRVTFSYFIFNLITLIIFDSFKSIVF